MMNTKKHGGLYRSDMRPVFRCNATQNKWMRIKKSVRTDEDGRQAFEHTADLEGDVVYFSFTYPYSYATLQSELASIEAAHTNTLDAPGSIYFNRELIACSIEQRRIDLLTITAAGGHSEQQEEVMPGLFPAHGIGDAACPGQALGAAGRPLTFPGREVIIVSARVHPGEVPAQHTMRGILDLLLDPHDPRSRALRERFVFKIVPMLNPDGETRVIIDPVLDISGANTPNTNHLIRGISRPFPHGPIGAEPQPILYEPGQAETTIYLRAAPTDRLVRG